MMVPSAMRTLVIQVAVLRGPTCESEGQPAARVEAASPSLNNGDKNKHNRCGFYPGSPDK